MQKLVFDIGLNNGDDAAYYLHLGYRVVGVEADPRMCAECLSRFGHEIRDRRMSVVNSGVLDRPGTFDFYRHRSDPGWSTFDPQRVKGSDWERIGIPCVTTAGLIEEYGQPFFIKIDIEGMDIQAVRSLKDETAPAYISLELNPSDPIIETLANIGYNNFKFVAGDNFRSAPPIFSHEFGWRAVRKLTRLMPSVKSLAAQFNAKADFYPAGRYSPDGYKFTSYSSGPFGEHASGTWMNANDALRWFNKLKRNHERDGLSLWWDLHARHSSCNPAEDSVFEGKMLPVSSDTKLI